jgi:hypothetical protein
VLDVLYGHKAAFDRQIDSSNVAALVRSQEHRCEAISSRFPMRPIVQPVQVIEIGDFPLNGSHIVADFGHGPVQFRLPTASDENVGSLFHKALSGSKPDSAAAPGDDSDFPL